MRQLIAISHTHFTLNSDVTSSSSPRNLDGAPAGRVSMQLTGSQAHIFIAKAIDHAGYIPMDCVFMRSNLCLNVLVFLFVTRDCWPLSPQCHRLHPPLRVDITATILRNEINERHDCCLSSTSCIITMFHHGVHFNVES